MIRFVYKTTNNKNGKIYIGQHSTENLDDGYLGSGVYIKKAFKKYGKENFKCEIIALADTKSDLDKAEEFFINHYIQKLGKNLIYNATERARGGWNKGIPAWNKGIPHTEEHKLKISESLKGRQFSEETKKKLSRANKNHPSYSKPVLCVETNTIYPSTHEASRQTGIAQQNIASVCCGIQKTSGGYHWKYIEK